MRDDAGRELGPGRPPAPPLAGDGDGEAVPRPVTVTVELGPVDAAVPGHGEGELKKCSLSTVLYCTVLYCTVLSTVLYAGVVVLVPLGPLEPDPGAIEGRSRGRATGDRGTALRPLRRVPQLT